ncbi:EAL domain-containing protein [Pseudoduganella sp. UC29_106]|uniref:EAL domain-containing protein n=1 Tax=Pseudoduganella sp. UC29_106 TaxID=3374553 RepID=UPI003756AED1
MATILIVDDRASNRDYLLTLLSFTEHTLLQANDGAQALQLAMKHRPDLVVTDILMPTMDGYEFVQRLRATAELCSTPVIFFSATYSVAEMRAMALSAGVRTVLPKPSDPQAILDAVAFELGEQQPANAPPPAALPRDIGRTGPRSALERMAALHQLSLRLQGERDSTSMARLFCEAAADIMEAEIAALCLLDPVTDNAHLVQAHGVPAVVLQTAILTQPGFPTSLLHEPGPLNQGGDGGTPPVMPPGHPPVRNLLGLPVRDAVHLYGWLYVANRSEGSRFTAEDSQIVQMLSAQLAVAYENSSLYATVQRHAAQLQLEATARRLADVALRANEARFRAMTQSAPDAIIGLDVNQRVLHFNSAAEYMFGYTEQEMLGREVTVLISERSRAEHQHRVERYRQTQQRLYSGRIVEVFCLKRSGEEFCAELALSMANVEGEQLFTAILRDTTARRALEDRLRLSAQVFDNTQECIMITDADAKIIAVNPAFEQITGYSEQEVLGQNPRMLRSGRHDAEFYKEIWDSLARDGQWRGEIWNRRKNGQVYPKRMSISTVRDSRNQVSAYVSVSTDLSDLKEAHHQLDFLSTHDALTLLPNRNLLNDRLQLAMSTAEHGSELVTLLLFNIDRLQRINDAFGRQAGDRLLQRLAQRMNLLVGPGDTLAHLGSDEFALVLTRCKGIDDVIVVARRLLEQVSQPVQLDGHDAIVTASIGISLYPRDGATPGALLVGADVALARAKESGRSSFRFFTAEMNTHALRWVGMENQLRRALERNELELHYQPQVSLADGRMNGMEALLRWNSAELGAVSPADFIPLAEDTGLILSIGNWVIEQACRQNKAWQHAGLAPHRVAVNVSARQFAAGDLPDVVRAALQASGLDARFLELELTESVMMQDSDYTQAQLAELAGIGVSIALDDFGTGYSSLSYLSRFALDKLKIDQAFVRDITSEPRSAAIAQATIALAHGLKLTVVAEGVETQGQLNFLRSIGCDKIQGYLFSRPLPADGLAALLREQRTLQQDNLALLPNRTLLLLDDEQNVLYSLVRLFRREGYRILVADNAREALELLAANDVQVVMADQRMPEISGTEFLARARELYPKTVRIVLSGFADLETVTDAINRGAVWRFLSKPWDDEELKAVIRAAFDEADLQRHPPAERRTG